MLSPLSRMNQSLQSPPKSVESVKRIGQPAKRGKAREDAAPSAEQDKENAAAPAVAPSLFGAPTPANYHASSGGFVHCRIDRRGKHRYHLFFQAEDAETVSMIANKVKTSRTSNYHVFDALRGGMHAKLTKKAGHYLGKLRHDKDQPLGCYTLYNSSREKEQMAAFVYDVPDLVQQMTDGQPPRKMQAVIPKHAPSKGGNSRQANNRLAEHLRNGTWKQHKLVAVQTRAPTYHDGQYRLNFSGRVLSPSVKNMQLEDEHGECLLQFGRVDDKTFHLDYKAPFSAFSAFGAALCQFDL